jgi:hypothetical protein
MKIIHALKIATAWLLLAIVGLPLSTAFGQGTAFTYQGRLNNGTNAASGTYNLTFTLFNTNTGGVAIAGPVTNNAVGVTDGLFTTTVDFGAGVFTGATNWLQIGVATNGISSFTTLTPRQQVTPTPYAIYAESAANLSGTLSASQLTSIGNTNGGSDNFFAGPSGNTTTSGNYNTASGTGALQNNGTGSGNTATGVQALYKNLNGGGNTAYGVNGLFDNTSGSYNTAIGYETLTDSGTTGSNTTVGAEALFSNASGYENTAVGFQALYANTVGAYNTAIGVQALNANTNGFFNTAIGEDTLLDNTSGNNNTALGAAALPNNTTGNYNTASGSQALFANGSGSDNTADGYEALFDNQGGFNNTASGASALYSNQNGTNNTAGGVQALYSNTSGSDNTASGYRALYSNTNGAFNTAYGEDALFSDTSGGQNTAIGYAASYANVNGAYNTAVGEGALQSNDDNYNTAVGADALAQATGYKNIALGEGAGSSVNTGNNNIEIFDEGTSSDDSTIRIGTQGTQTTTYIAGIAGETAASGVPVYITANGQLGTLTSSARFKTNIQSMAGASDELLSLRPVTFRYKPEIDPKGIPQFGLVAKEVEKVDPALVARDNQGRIYTVRYEAVNAMLLNEFQKEHRKVESQDTEIQDLKARPEKLEQLVAGKDGGAR